MLIRGGEAWLERRRERQGTAPPLGSGRSCVGLFLRVSVAVTIWPEFSVRLPVCRLCLCLSNCVCRSTLPVCLQLCLSLCLLSLFVSKSTPLYVSVSASQPCNHVLYLSISFFSFCFAVFPYLALKSIPEPFYYTLKHRYASDNRHFLPDVLSWYNKNMQLVMNPQNKRRLAIAS